MLHAWRMRKHMDALAGMHLARLFLGEMVFRSCELFSFQSGRKSCSIFVLYPRYSGFPNSSFVTWELTPSCTPSILYPCYHGDRNVKMLHQSSFIKTKNDQDLYIGRFVLKMHWTSPWICGPVAVTSWHDKFGNLFSIWSFSKIQDDKVNICLKFYVFKASRLR